MVVVGAAGCSPAADTPSSSGSTGGTTTVSTSSATQSQPSANALGRALTLIAAAPAYAFTMVTWEISSGEPQILVQTDGVRVAPWTSLHVRAGTDGPQADIVYSDGGAAGREAGRAWMSAAALFDSVAWLQEVPLESELIAEDLISQVTSAARPVDPARALPSPAPPAPSGAAQAFAWSNSLVTGARVDADVSTTVWLNQAGWVLRLDRETIPIDPAAGLRHTYTVIDYSRHADSDLVLPVSGFEAFVS